MTLTQLRKLFSAELADRYAFEEIQILFSIVAAHILKNTKAELRLKMDSELSAAQTAELTRAVDQLKSGTPYQHILGEIEFYGLSFFVNEHVLIPRPETEELLELAISKIKEVSNKSLKILDIGTGSGVIPIILKKNFPSADITAIDFSQVALTVARKNTEAHGVEINFVHQDYLEVPLSECYDIIISNPPYIGIDEENEIADSVKSFEPHMALFSPTPNALVFYEKIAADCREHLAEGGFVFVEINQKLGAETLRLFTEVLESAALVRDISGNERFVWGRK